MGEEQQQHALAKRIRSAVDAETFDLGGMSEQQIHSILTSAFREPFDLEEMVRLTFTVGGGKLVRTRYDDSMPRWCSQALKSIDFTEDKSASNDLSSAGCFKFHHDTGKNLKQIVVFPFIQGGGAGGGAGGPEGEGGLGAEGAGAGGANGGGADAREKEMVLSVSLALFPDMMRAKCPSWSQKQRCLKDVLMPLQEQCEGLEARMVRGEQLTERENALYEELGGAHLKEKGEWVQGAMKRQVDQGELTKADREKLLAQMDGKLASLKEELGRAKEEKKDKKVGKLEEQLAALEERRKKAAEASAVVFPLKREPDLKPLSRRLASLTAERNAIKGRLLSVQEVRKFSEIDRLEEQVAALVQESRGFFEADEELEARARHAKKKALAGYKGEPTAKKPAAARSTGGWASVGGGGRSRGASSSSSSGAKRPGNAFAALGDDSD